MRYSEKELLNKCPTAYKYRFIEGLKKQYQAESEHHIKWGQAVHAGLEELYKKEGLERAEKAFLQIYPMQLDEADKAKTVNNGLLTLRQYERFYREQDKQWQVLATEHEGKMKIADDEGDHGLHIDLIARYIPSGEVYFWDHKTSGKRTSDSYWKGFEISGQITRYTKYIRDEFGDCSGCYINNICVQWIDKPSSLIHPEEANLERLKLEYSAVEVKYSKYYKKDMVYASGLHIGFERQLFNRTLQQIRFWEESDRDWMKTLEIYKASNFWPKALNSGCGWCEFYELCLASGDEEIKKVLYSTSGNEEEEFNVEVA